MESQGMTSEDLVHALYQLGMPLLRQIEARLQDGYRKGYRPAQELLVETQGAIDLLDTDIGTALGGG